MNTVFIVSEKIVIIIMSALSMEALLFSLCAAIHQLLWLVKAQPTLVPRPSSGFLFSSSLAELAGPSHGLEALLARARADSLYAFPGEAVSALPRQGRSTCVLLCLWISADAVFPVVSEAASAKTDSFNPLLQISAFKPRLPWCSNFWVALSVFFSLIVLEAHWLLPLVFLSHF